MGPALFSPSKPSAAPRIFNLCGPASIVHCLEQRVHGTCTPSRLPQRLHSVHHGELSVNFGEPLFTIATDIIVE